MLELSLTCIDSYLFKVRHCAGAVTQKKKCESDKGDIVDLDNTCNQRRVKTFINFEGGA